MDAMEEAWRKDSARKSQLRDRIEFIDKQIEELEKLKAQYESESERITLAWN
jgi:hypothetical protein